MVDDTYFLPLLVDQLYSWHLIDVFFLDQVIHFLVELNKVEIGQILGVVTFALSLLLRLVSVLQEVDHIRELRAQKEWDAYQGKNS